MDPAGIGVASRSVLVRLSCIAGEQIGTRYEARTQDVLDRFKLWAGNIGALHADYDPYSLAHRLRSAPKLKSEVQRLLDDVSDDIAELTTALQACEHQPAHIHGSSDECDQDFDVSTILAVIAESITSLLKISGLSRRTAERDQYAIALRRVGRDAVASEASELETLTSVHRRLRGEGLSWLGIRLAEANSQRRRFLRHQEDHQMRIEAGGLQTSERPSRPETIEVDAPGDLFALSEDRSQYGKSAASTAADIINNAPFASDLDEDVDSIYTYETDTMGFERSRTITLQELIDEGEITDPTQGFICRYCKNEVFFARESAWRKHIMSDLRAYVCLAKDCELRMFDDSKTWFEHELSEHHTQRVCPYCNQTFPSLEELKEHFRVRHADAINEEHLDQLAALDKRAPSHISAKACVFCDWTSKLRNQARYRDKEEVDVPLHRYRRHVGNHLEQAALAVLPPLPGTLESDDEHELSNDSDAENVGGSHAHSLPSPRDEATNEYQKYEAIIENPDGRHQRVNISSDDFDALVEQRTLKEQQEQSRERIENARMRVENIERYQQQMAAGYERERLTADNVKQAKSKVPRSGGLRIESGGNVLYLEQGIEAITLGADGEGGTRVIINSSTGRKSLDRGRNTKYSARTGIPTVAGLANPGSVALSPIDNPPGMPTRESRRRADSRPRVDDTSSESESSDDKHRRHYHRDEDRRYETRPARSKSRHRQPRDVIVEYPRRPTRKAYTTSAGLATKPSRRESSPRPELMSRTTSDHSLENNKYESSSASRAKLSRDGGHIAESSEAILDLEARTPEVAHEADEEDSTRVTIDSRTGRDRLYRGSKPSSSWNEASRQPSVREENQ